MLRARVGSKLGALVTFLRIVQDEIGRDKGLGGVSFRLKDKNYSQILKIH